MINISILQQEEVHNTTPCTRAWIAGVGGRQDNLPHDLVLDLKGTQNEKVGEYTYSRVELGSIVVEQDVITARRSWRIPSTSTQKPSFFIFDLRFLVLHVCTYKCFLFRW